MSFLPPYCSISDFERDTPSPYPPSTPSTSDDEDEHPIYMERSGLRASVAALPDQQLRTIVMRLLDSNQGFRRAMQKEVAFVDSDGELDTPPTTPTMATHRRGKPKRGSRRRKSRGHGEKKEMSISTHRSLIVRPESPTPSVRDDDDECVYHPGHLEDEVYEFVSGTPDGAAFKVVQTVTMWSCCNEDGWSPGCALIAPTFSRHDSFSSLSNAERGSCFDELRSSRPSSQLGMNGLTTNAKRRPLDITAWSSSSLEKPGQGGDDVYPDSELESPYDGELLTPVRQCRGEISGMA